MFCPLTVKFAQYFHILSIGKSYLHMDIQRTNFVYGKWRRNLQSIIFHVQRLLNYMDIHKEFFIWLCLQIILQFVLHLQIKRFDSGKFFKEIKIILLVKETICKWDGFDEPSLDILIRVAYISINFIPQAFYSLISLSMQLFFQLPQNQNFIMYYSVL